MASPMPTPPGWSPPSSAWRGDLAHVLTKEGLAFHRFEGWSEIALVLCDPLIVRQNPHQTAPTEPRERA